MCRFAPETIRVNGRLSSNVYELLISHRVKSRTCDLRGAAVPLSPPAMATPAQKNIPRCLTPVGNSLQNSERGGHSFVQDI